MNAISGRTTKIRTMSNGQPRIEIELDCTLAEVAALFDVGAEVALARLNCKPEPQPEKPKGGQLAKLAGQLCASEAFQKYINKEIFGYADDRHVDESEAARAIRFICQISSRAELDYDLNAASRFHEHIRKPFLEWQEKNA